MELEKLSLISDIASQFATAIAIIAGGAWAYWNFVIKRVNVWNLSVVIDPEIYPYKGSKKLLVINVTLKNVGNVKISPGSKGCRLTVYKLPKNKNTGESLDWEKYKTLLKDVDILRRYKGKRGYQGYEIEPNCEYDEFETLVVKKGELILIKADFWWLKNEDVINDYKVVHVK
ncbi:MAG: hypothetical protein A2W22_02820 [Candidatus Levybacteria bacterium RBG_16_35_11]|nr:MAG: hypothetical protein A2W22_02820 [Candidatus Levybacteria bacterium RBG_16_35_11]